MIIDFWFNILILLILKIRRTLAFGLESARAFVCMILNISSSTLRACSVWLLRLVIFRTFLFKKQLDVNFLMIFIWRRFSKWCFCLLLNVSYMFLLSLYFDWFSDHWVLEKSIKDSQTCLILYHGPIKLWAFLLWSCGANWVSSRFWLWTFVKIFWVNLGLKTSLNLFFFNFLLFIAKMLLLLLSIIYVFIHSVDEFLFLIQW